MRTSNSYGTPHYYANWTSFTHANGKAEQYSSITGVCRLCQETDVWDKTVMLAFGSLSCSVSSTMAGGDFWDGVCNGLICAGLNHVMHLVEEISVSKYLANKYVAAVRAFLVDLGYNEEQVNQDVTVQQDVFFGKYYAQMDEMAFESKYKSSFTGAPDSRNSDRSAYISTKRTIHYTNSFGFKTKDSFALKYYPKRSNSIGIIRTGVYHYYEASMELVDGAIRNLTGKDNVVYDMHGSNSEQFLKLRELYPAQLWK